MGVYSAFWITTILLASVIRARRQALLFFLVVFVFVGLRYETGFDWPVYKSIFESMRDGISLERIAFVQLSHDQETGFIVILGLLAQLFSSYEVPQALFTIFFLYSVWRLASSIPGCRPALALALFYSVYLLPVGFSTVRQSVAMGLFNLALYKGLQGKALSRNIYLLAAVFMHLSSLAYISAYALARLDKVRNMTVRLFIFGALSVALLLLLPIVLEVASLNVPLLANRIGFYEGRTLVSTLDRFALVYAFLFVFMGGVVILNRHVVWRETTGEALLQRLIVILASMCIASLYFYTLRDRLAYEAVLLFALFVSTRITLSKSAAAIVIVLFGINYQTAILRPPRQLAFVPYQNSIVMYISGKESSGQQRSRQYMTKFIESMNN